VSIGFNSTMPVSVIKRKP